MMKLLKFSKNNNEVKIELIIDELIQLLQKYKSNKNILRILKSAKNEYKFSEEKGKESLRSIFGGMGSINDIVLSSEVDNKKLNDLLDVLYQKVK